MEKRRVVITGMGTVNPIGNSVAESWQAVKDGKCGIGPITRYDCSNMRVKLAGEVKDLDIDGILGKREAKKMDRFTQFALIAAQQAMDDSGLDREREDLSRCGVICSSGIGGFETVGGAFLRGESRGYDSVSPFMIPMIISNMAAGQIAIRFGFQGMCTCVVTACAGGTNAVGDAFRHIRDGYGDVMLCGGAEAAITPLAMGGFTAIVRDFQAVISKEIKAQVLEREGRLPDAVLACVGGGSNAIGAFYHFIDDPSVRLIGCEAAGRGVDTADTAATIATGRLGIFHGMKSYFCQDQYGQIAPVYSISAGLDYPGIGPEHAWLHDIGRAEYVPVTDDEAVNAFEYTSRMEGIIPAIESAHAVAHAMKLAPTMGRDQIMVVNISGRGDKDCAAIARYRGEEVSL